MSNDTGIALEEIDVVYIVYEHVLQDARNRIYDATGYDFVNDSLWEIYTYGNFIGICYDYTEEARERLIAEIANIDITQREELLDEFLLRFFEYINITKAAEAELEDILIIG